MRLLVSLALLLLVSSSSLLDEEDRFNLDYEKQLPEDHPRKLVINNAVKGWKDCREKNWICRKECRAQRPVLNNDTFCMRPLPGDSCFGLPIDYTYLSSSDLLPSEFEVLKRFPDCWSVLGPMLCGMIYRPCHLGTYIAKGQTDEKLMDSWQRFPIVMCTRVHEHCKDAIKEGFFPSQLINCNRTAENRTWLNEKTNANGTLAPFVPSGNEEELKDEWERRTLFSDDCTLPYSKNASSHDPMQCIFPLVYAESHERIRPVIDQCYLPCRNPLISSPDQFLSFLIFRALICFGLAISCMGIVFFLAARSVIFLNSDAVFSIACCLLSFAVYLICWGTGSIGPLAELSECTLTTQGVAIRNTLVDSKWCWLTSAVSHVSLLASIGFLATAYALNAASASKAAARENKREQKAFKKSNDSFSSFSRPGVRFWLVAGVVLLSAAIGMIAVGFSMASTDGIAGVCSVGLHSIVHHLTVVAVPGVLYCAIALIWGVWSGHSEEKHREAEISDAIEQKIYEAIARAKANEKVDFAWDRGPRQKEDLLERIQRCALTPLEERTEASGSTEGGALRERREEEEMEKCEEQTEGDEQPLVPIDEEEKEWIGEAEKQQIRDSVREQQEAEWRGRDQRAWHEGVSSCFTLVALWLCLAALLCGLLVHYLKLANDGTSEYEAVRGYVTCVVKKTFVRKDTQWLHASAHAAEKWNNGTAVADPLERRRDLASGMIAIHSCEFPTSGDDRIFGLLFVFIIFPLVPVAVFIWAFIAGFAGLGTGMAMVRKRRLKTEKPKFVDLEMTALTERDEDSRKLSSVCSSRGYHPSSTVSTSKSSAVSEVSAASSTHSSVSASLRGVLPRFPSAERLMTIRATSPVPSASRSVPARRNRSLQPHRRRLDVMGRKSLQREESRKRKKKTMKRASSTDRNARREGVAESGQLVPRGAAALRVNGDARSVSSHSTARTMLSGETSSYLAPPSELGRARIRNARALLRRVAREADERGDGMQQRLQLLQEELMLRTLPADVAGCDPQEDAQMQQNWIDRLISVRDSLFDYQYDTVYGAIVTQSIHLIGSARELARISNANGSLSSRSINFYVLQFVLESIDHLAFAISQRQAPTPELAAAIQNGLMTLQQQLQVNQLPNARELLQVQEALHYPTGPFVLDVDNDERVRQRRQMWEEEGTVERVNQWLETMLAATNRRYVLSLVERERLARYAAAAVQHQLLQPQQQGVGRPPVYAPVQHIDLRLPPNGVGARSQAVSAYSVTNSTVPSSAMTTHEGELAIQLYLETNRLPPNYDGPSCSSNQGAAAAAAPTQSHLTASFVSDVMRANGRTADGQPAAAFAVESARFPAPTSSSNGLNDTHTADDDDDDDDMSSETSMDSMGRRTAPSETRRRVRDMETVDVQRSPPAAASAAGQQLQQPQATNAPRLFPFLTASGAAVPMVPIFPGARPMGPLYATLEEQQAAASTSSSASSSPSAPEAAKRRPDENQKKKRKVAALGADEASSCQEPRRMRSEDDDSPSPPPPPAVNRVFIQEQPNGLPALPLNGLSSAATTTASRKESATDSGIDSIASLNLHNFRLVRISDGAPRPAEGQDINDWVEQEARAARLAGIRPRPNARRDMAREERRRQERRQWEEEEEEKDAGSSNEEERRRRERMRLRNQYLNHSDPDLAMAEEERARRRDEEREREQREREEEEQRERIAEARERQRRERGEVAVDQQAEEVSISSPLTAEEQRDLVLQLRAALENLPTDGMQPEHRRLVAHLRLALDTQGGISREEIMRYRVAEHNRESRERQDPNRNSPYSVSSVVISRMSLAEIGARVAAIRALSASTLYPLEVYYQLHLADVLWPLAGRDVMLGDNIYTRDEINRVLGSDSPMVPADADSDDFHQLMRKRAITAASLTGRAYGRRRDAEGPRYEPPRLPDMGLYRAFQDPTVVMAAIGGDLEPIRRVIAGLELTMPDVMRLDNRSEHTLGAHLRHFRDLLDDRAHVAGFPVREDAYVDEEVPQEPTGSRTQPKADPAAKKPPAPDPEF